MKALRGMCLLVLALGFSIDLSSALAKPRLDSVVDGEAGRAPAPKPGAKPGVKPGPENGSTNGPTNGPSDGAETGALPVNPPAALPDQPPSPSDNGASIRGASPALGPAPAKDPVKDIGVDFLITKALRQKVDEILVTANANLAQQTSVRAKVNVGSFKVFGVGASATAATDRPNHNYVRIPYMLSYKVSDVQKKVGSKWVATGVTRTISQSIELKVFCDAWETGKGNVKLVTKIDPLYLEDSQGTLEQVVDFFLNGHLTQLIDGVVRQALSQIPIQNSAGQLPFTCNSLTANTHGSLDTVDDTIDFNLPSSKRVPPVLTAFNQITFKLLSIERLPAKELGGATLYQDVESPQLEVYANFSRTGGQLASISNGQVQALNFPQLSFTRPPNNGPLVIIANIIQANNSSTTDSAYRLFSKSVNYGNGTQAIIIKKSYWRPPTPPIKKPTEFLVDAYKVVFQIVAPTVEVADQTVGGSKQLLSK